jgi:hypothetical protein
MFTRTNQTTELKCAIDAAIGALKNSKYAERKKIRQLLEDGLDAWKRFELFAADADTPVRPDGRGLIGPEPTSANKPSTIDLVNIILGR